MLRGWKEACDLLLPSLVSGKKSLHSRGAAPGSEKAAAERSGGAVPCQALAGHDGCVLLA